jgi:hypothetical protein
MPLTVIYEKQTLTDSVPSGDCRAGTFPFVQNGLY